MSTRETGAVMYTNAMHSLEVSPSRTIFASLGISVVVIAVFLFATVTQAQEPEQSPTLQDDRPAEVVADETVSAEDLGAVKARILPDSPLHFFKRLGRGVQEVLTVDPVNDAALKLKHANQQLSETNQLIKQKGLGNISPAVIVGAMGVFESKISSVRNVADSLKDAKTTSPELVDKLLNNLTDKQLKQQKVLDTIAKQVIEVKVDAQQQGVKVDVRIERVLSSVNETKKASINNFTDILLEVDEEPDVLTERVTRIMDTQGGSEFRDLKNLEILEAMADSAPQNVQETIAIAKKNTIEKFETRIKALPEVVRAEKFEKYVEHATADETKLMGLLEEIKQSTNIPPEILGAIEEAKEIVARKFVQKLEIIEDEDVQASLVKQFDAHDLDDLIALEELRNRMGDQSKGRAFVEEYHDASVAEFKSAFSDVESQNQAALFEKLSRDAQENPNPKTFKLLRELEQEVRSDPTKAAFLDSLEDDMERDMHRRFRIEGDRYMDRIASLDPHDIEIFEELDFEKSFEDRFVQRQSKRMRDHMQDIVIPEQFDRFHERFFDSSDFVINEIRRNDNSFQDAMQYKVRRMEETRLEREQEIARASLDYEERELWHQFDRLEQQKEEDFWKKLDALPWDDFESRQRLWDEKLNDRVDDVGARYEEQKRIFERRTELDPWCDEICQGIQVQYIEQDFRHEKERLSDELIRQRNQIERDKSDYYRDNPLAGKCFQGEDCDRYCQAHAGEPGCEWVVPYCERGYWDFGRKECVVEETPITDCGPGFYYDFGRQSCVRDPYWIPPPTFRDCGPGAHWNEHLGYCEPDEHKNQCKADNFNAFSGDVFCDYSYCSNGCVWENGCPVDCQEQSYCNYNNYCDPEENRGSCPQDCGEPSACNYDGRCDNNETEYSCPNDCRAPNECNYNGYCDPHEVASCSDCQVDDRCGAGWYWDDTVRGCVKEGSYCDNYSACSACPPDQNNIDTWCNFDGKGCPKGCGGMTGGECGDGSCNAFENSGSCPEDCGAPDCPVDGLNPSGRAWDCGYSFCGWGCNYDDNGCVTSCADPCNNDGICNADENAESCSDCTYSGSCVDTDAGKDYTAKGTVTDEKGSYTDVCQGDMLLEYYCDGNIPSMAMTSQVQAAFSPAPHGIYCPNEVSGSVCHDGACVVLDTTPYCGNNLCERSETPGSCPEDCSGSQTCNYNGQCEKGEGENCKDCALLGDCRDNAQESMCYDQPGCKWFETYCEGDDHIPPTCNNNGVCDVGEGYSTCADDCGSGSVCTPTKFNGQTNKYNYCETSYCTDGCTYDSNSCADGCSIASGNCGDGTCSTGESFATCPDDCSAQTCTPDTYTKEDGSCNLDQCPDGCTFYEESGCPSGCDSPVASCNNDGVCDASESKDSCPSDCKAICTDSDGGKDYSSKGSTTGFAADGQTLVIREDLCVESGVNKGKLAENHCLANDIIGIEYYSCPIACSGGVCADSIPDTIPPVISNVVPSLSSDTTAAISCSLDEEASLKLNYSEDPNMGYPSWSVHKHSDGLACTLGTPGLAPITTYYFTIEATDAAGNTSVSDIYSITTKGTDVTPPKITTAVAAQNKGVITFAWVTDEETTGHLDAAGQTHTTPLSKYHQMALTGDQAPGAYSYTITVTDRGGNVVTKTDSYTVNSYCGDLMCDADEDSNSCAADCPGGAASLGVFSRIASVFMIFWSLPAKAFGL